MIVRDEFTGTGPHRIEVNFQFAPGTLALGGEQARLTDVADLAWTGTVPWTAEVATGREAPDEGWIARSLGVRVPAPRLRLSASMTAGRAVLMTVLAATA